MNHASTPRTSGRSGFSLIETLLAVSLFAIILSVIGPALAAMLRVHANVTMDLQLQRAVDRLSDDFRRDARRARECRLIQQETASAIELLSDAGTTTYSFHESHADNYLRRKVTTGDNTAGSAVDAYALAPGALVEFTRSVDGQVLGLQVTAPWSPHRPEGAFRRWIITARMRNQI